MKSVHIYITGDVIGVGFRSFIKRNADNLKITGWVKNLSSPQNAVEAVFQGEKEDIEKIIDLCKKGPEISWVKDIKIKLLPEIENYSEFTIKAS
ncbi:acylphosphatase [Candidatus Gottesmanbacteria bacterium]|nr:acylphosphatase [Candidatus Gottesmanbacteria bacterium]